MTFPLITRELLWEHRRPHPHIVKLIIIHTEQKKISHDNKIPLTVACSENFVWVTHPSPGHICQPSHLCKAAILAFKCHHRHNHPAVSHLMSKISYTDRSVTLLPIFGLHWDYKLLCQNQTCWGFNCGIIKDEQKEYIACWNVFSNTIFSVWEVQAATSDSLRKIT